LKERSFFLKNQTLKTNILNLNSMNKKKQSNKTRNNAQFDVSIKHLKQTLPRPALKARVESGATASTTGYTSQYKRKLVVLGWPSW